MSLKNLYGGIGDLKENYLDYFQDYFLFPGPGWLELDWKCPGRRPPTPPDEANKVEEEDAPADDGKDLAFDFEDEFTSSGTFNTPQQRRPLGGTLKGSARKKTTSLDGVLSNMRRHKEIEDNMEQDK